MKKKLFIFFIFTLSAGIALMGLLTYTSTKDTILENTKDNLKAETRFAGEYIKNINLNGNIDNLAIRIKDIIGKRVTIIDSDGQVIGESDIPGAESENFLNRPEIKEALDTGSGSSIRFNDNEKSTIYYYAARYRVNNRVYVIRLSTQINSIKKMQLTYLSSVIISVMIGIIISSILVLIYLNIFDHSIEMLTQMATTIALGQYEKRINISSKEDMGQLGHAFNLMADRLQETIVDLSDKRNKLISILTSMDDGVVVVDNNEKIILINPAAKRLFNIHGEATGRHFIEIVRNYGIEDIIKNMPEEDIEININYPDIKILRIKSTRVVNYDKNNESIGVLLVIQDITKIRTLEKMRSDFVANVSHELKTPLTSIKGFAETLKYVEDKETREKFLDIIYVESERLSRLINDILILSELENKESAINFEKINLKKSMEEVFYIMEPVAKNKSINLTFNLNGDKSWILGDRDRLKQMMINLIDNSIKYTNDGGYVKVELTSDQERAFVTIRDNGVGISEEHLPRLFERFYRADKARSRSQGGTGLGLAIVKHIVILLNGEINVESKVGEGTIFTISFPKCK